MSYGFNNDKSKFPLGSASDLPDPSKTPMEIIGDLQKQIIDSASIENGSTASKAYAAGDYVCFQGALCKASQAISQGDTLSIGDSADDNLTLTDAAAEFARINSNLSDKANRIAKTYAYHSLTVAGNSMREYTCPDFSGISGSKIVAQYPVIIENGNGITVGRNTDTDFTVRIWNANSSSVDVGIIYYVTYYAV